LEDPNFYRRTYSRKLACLCV